MKHIITLVFAMISLHHIHAGNKLSDSHISGHVIDKSTGEHIPFMTIILEGTSHATTTDATGHYFLKNLPWEPIK